MQNFNLLRELGLVRKPVLLKRGIAATIEELLLSAEYILSGENYDVMLCERGIRTFETYTRNTMEFPPAGLEASFPSARPGRSFSRYRSARYGSRHGARLGRCGLRWHIVEVHPNPDKAVSDGAQSLFPQQFEQLMDELRIIATAVGRSIGPRAHEAALQAKCR